MAAMLIICKVKELVVASGWFLWCIVGYLVYVRFLQWNLRRYALDLVSGSGPLSQIPLQIWN